MAESNPKPRKQGEVVEADQSNAAPAIVREPTAFPVDTHLSQSQGMYGQPTHVVAGALAYLAKQDGEAKDKYTKAEVGDAVTAFLTQPITEGEGH